jgi:hypothetical protein
MTNSQTSNVGDLFQTAHDDGVLSGQSLQVLTVVDLGTAIQAGLGVSVNDVQSSEATAVAVLMDDSGSMSRMADEARQGQQLVIDSLRDSKQANAILMHTRLLSGAIVDPYVLVEQATRLDGRNYMPRYPSTPLFDASLQLLGTAVAKAQEFADNGVPARTVSLIVSDGGDNSSRHKAAEVAAVVADMRRAENHIVAAMGIDDGGYTDFTAIFVSMGIDPAWILTPGNTESELRAAFQVFSQSAVRASQVANFSQMGGGFAS